MKYIDTTEAGGGSYPEPLEPKEKCYRFKCLCEVDFDCWGKDKDDAMQYCNLQDYADMKVTSIEDVIDWSVVN